MAAARNGSNSVAEISFTIMREIGRQVVWSAMGEEGEDETMDVATHSPYA